MEVPLSALLLPTFVQAARLPGVREQMRQHRLEGVEQLVLQHRRHAQQAVEEALHVLAVVLGDPAAVARR